MVSIPDGCPFLTSSKTNSVVSSNIYDKRNDFNFQIVGDVPGSTSYCVFIPQLIRFARVCSNVRDFNNRNQFLHLSY